MLVSKCIKEDKLEFTYKYYEYNTDVDISVEYTRYKLIKKLNIHFLKALNITNPKELEQKMVPYSVMHVLLYGIAKNLNTTDPVLIQFDATSITTNFPATIDNPNLNKIIDSLNNKISKYIKKLDLPRLQDPRILKKYTTSNQIAIQIADRENTKILVNDQIYNKIILRYKERNTNFDNHYVDKLIWSALFRYKYLGILDGNQGAVNEKELLYF